MFLMRWKWFQSSLDPLDSTQDVLMRINKSVQLGNITIKFLEGRSQKRASEKNQFH